jgi:peptide deformylase
MQTLRILCYPDPMLRQVAKPIDTEQEGRLAHYEPFIAELVRALYLYDGVAIAAPQVAAHVRIIVVDLRPDTPEGKRMPAIPLVMINPKLTRTGNDELGDPLVTELEGCLSFPGVQVLVQRHLVVTAEFVGKDGEPVVQEFAGLQARAVQHEIEHLDGVLLVDHITSRLRRDMVDRKMKAVRRRGGLKPKAIFR